MERYPVLAVYLQCTPKIGYRPIPCLQHGATHHGQKIVGYCQRFIWGARRRDGFGGAFCFRLKSTPIFGACSARVWKR